MPTTALTVSTKTMHILVDRFGYGKDSTAGLLFVDGKNIGFTLEDEQRNVKVMDETCIPKGVYEVKLRAEGGMHRRYSNRFTFHKGMIHLQDVKDFSWIYIHVGNTEEHTSGCILVGRGCTYNNGEYTVSSSVDAYTELYKHVLDAMDQGQKILVEVR